MTTKYKQKKSRGDKTTEKETQKMMEGQKQQTAKNNIKRDETKKTYVRKERQKKE